MEDQNVKLQEWILDNLGDWLTICGLNERPISREKFMMLYKTLKEQGFQELPFVLLVHHFYAVSEEINIIMKGLELDNNETL